MILGKLNLTGLLMVCRYDTVSMNIITPPITRQYPD